MVQIFSSVYDVVDGSCKLTSAMQPLFKQKLKRVVLGGFASVLVGLILLVITVAIKLKTHTPIMAYNSLAAALERADWQEIDNLSTPNGLKRLQEMTSLYGEKRLGRYLTSQNQDLTGQNRVGPYMHAPGTAAVLLGVSKAPQGEAKFDVVVFFRWTWNGWKLAGIAGKPIFQPTPATELKPTGD